MYDMGVYPLNAARYASGMEPIAVTARASTTWPEIYHEVEETMAFDLEFPGGATAQCETSFGRGMNDLQVKFEKGSYELSPFQAYSGFTVGAEMIPLDATLGEPYGTEHGLLVLRVGPRTPAARAGIQKGDVLITVNGRELRSVSALIRAVERADKPELRLELLRKRERKVVALEW